MATIEPNFESICINPNDDLVLYKKEIVRSRIEKFLYAICSLDTDDLPTPLSRVEELYNCLVTGEDIPTFTPLSRGEKFVMAMLGAYDVELLPTPISRSETLMKKIATGDNNLDDVDNLQSRYEFLLAYIIKAGGFNGGNPSDSRDFYYKLTSLTSDFTTIYDTSDMPVKNAVLRGQTLVNLVGTYKHTISTVNKPIVWGQKRLFLTNIKPNTIYTLRVKMTEVVKGNYGPRVQIFFTTYSTGEINTTTSTSDTLIFISPAELNSDAHLRLIVTGSEAEATEVDFEILLLEGTHPDIKDIPYFDYMQSVKMPVLTTVGKNLFDGEFNLSTYSSGKIIIPNGIISSVSFPYTTTANSRGIGCITQVKPNTNYTISIVDKQENTVLLGDGYNNLNDISSQTKSVLHVGSVDNANHTTLSFTTPSNCNYMIIGCYIKYSYAQSGGTITFNEPPKIQLEENSVLTSYEPHKSTTVSCNEEVELRRIGDIKDELNLVTGELVQKIGTYTFTGDENWIVQGGETGGYTYFACYLGELIVNYDYNYNIPLTCNRLPLITYNDLDNGLKNVGINLTYCFRLNFSDCDSNQGATVEDLKAYLKVNPTTVQYPTSRSVKTVDLSTLDQDGKETELSTFDDITHVIASSEGLIPTGNMLTSRPIYFMNYSLDNSLTTLYNTVNYPVKNAVLKGQTLVNVSSLTGVTTLKPGDVIFIENTGMKKNTTYTIMFNCSNIPSTNFVEVRTMMDNTLITQAQQNVSSGYNKFTIKTNTSKETNRFRFKNDASATTDFIFSELVILEGDYTNENIPYFEGMASVKMPILTTTGKNLYNKTPFNGFIDSSNGTFVYNNSTTRKISDYIEVKSNATYKVSGCTMTAMWGYDKDKNPVSAINIYTDYITTTNNMRFIAFNIDSTLEHSNIQIEEGTVATLYEPHKSTTVSCNEEVELRGIGNIKDELNLMTGKLTQRIGEVVLDGSEDWQIDSDTNDYRLALSLEHNGKMLKYTKSICDKYPTETGKQSDTTYNYVYIGSTSINLYENPTMTLEEFKNKLKQNPITFQYQLTTESVKTVDLSTLDQDGKETEVNTFDDITHVIASSEGLIPTGEIDIARPIQFVDYSLDNGETTLYNTIEYPVKNAVLRGQTLVNIYNPSLSVNLGNIEINDNVFTFNGSGCWVVSNNKLPMLKPNTTYTLIVNIISNTLDYNGTINDYALQIDGDNNNTAFANVYKIPRGGVGVFKTTSTTKSEFSTTNLSDIRISPTAISGSIRFTYMIIEGDYTNVDIPYFTGMSSVKMPVLTTTGKNLYPYGDSTINNPVTNVWYYTNGIGAKFGSSCKRTDGGNWFYLENGVYSYSSINENTQSTIVLVGEGEVLYNPGKEVPSGWYVFRFKTKKESVNYAKISQIQIEKGSNNTTYEPYKSTTVSCNEEVELHGMSDIKDELNLATGELVQKIGTYTFTGDEPWMASGPADGAKYFILRQHYINPPILGGANGVNLPIICDRLPTIKYSEYTMDNGGINFTYDLRINFTDCNCNQGATAEDLKAYLKANPTTIYYPTIEVVKTVDLSTLDQDGKETKLRTFDDITHVIASSEGLIPTGEITVATKNATDVIDASAMSLRMNNILNSQGTLEGFANTQSDDIDVTMLGATDIYEQLL